MRNNFFAVTCSGMLWLLFIVMMSRPCIADSATCLHEIQRSIDEADFSAFEQLVNVNGILDEGLSVFVSEMSREENSVRMPPMINLLVSGLTGMQGKLTRPPVLQEITAFIRNGIASGAFAGNPAKLQKSSGIIAPFFDNASMGRKKITFIGQEKRVEDGTEAAFFVHDYGNGNDYPVIGLFKDTENSFCLAAIRNFPELFNQIIAESAQ